MHDDYKYPPLSTARYSVTQLIELEQCSVNELVQNTTKGNDLEEDRRDVGTTS